MRHQGRKNLWRLIRIIVPIALLTWVFRGVDWSSFKEIWGEADRRWLLAGFGLYLGAVFLQGSRLYALLGSDGMRRNFLHLQLVNSLAMFFDTFTPGKLGSDGYRVVTLRAQGGASHIISALIALRLQGLLTSIACAAAAVVLLFGGTGPIAGFILAAALLAAILVVLAPKAHRLLKDLAHHLQLGRGMGHSIGSRLGDFTFAMGNMRRRPGMLGLTFALAVIFILVNACIYAVVGKAFHLELTFTAYLGVVPVLLVASVLPITIHGRGLTEFLAVSLWLSDSVSREQILVTVLAVYAIALIHSLLNGIAWASLHTLKRDGALNRNDESPTP